MLIIKTLGAPPPPARRRRRPRKVEPATEPASLPLTRATAVRAFAPFEDEEDATRWLDEATEAEDTADVLIADGIALLNRALYVHAVAAADPQARQLTPERAVAVRIGYGAGEEVADSGFSAEDLVSNLIGFYRAVEAPRDYIALCEPVSRQEAWYVWDTYGAVGQNKNKEFSPYLYPTKPDSKLAPIRVPLPAFLNTITPEPPGALYKKTM